MSERSITPDAWCMGLFTRRRDRVPSQRGWRDLSDPTDFQSLIGAGKSALEMGDAQAAAGFFARADEVNPRSPLPQAGMGAVSVANGDPQAALPYFRRAQQLGAPLATFACDRGLAYDLMGQQSQAQADYRVAMAGRDGDEARRRLALSLAISGNRDGALQLEALWNDVMNDRAFHLHCAYPRKYFGTDDGEQNNLVQVCRSHSHIIIQ